MNIVLIILLGCLTIVYQTDSFILQSGENEANKTDSSILKKDDTVQKAESRLSTDVIKKDEARKQFNNFKRFEVRKRTEDDEKNNSEEKTDEKNNKIEKKDEPVQPKKNEHSNVESIVLAIDTGATETPIATNTDIIDKLEQAVNDLAKTRDDNSPLMRASEQYNIKPELIQFRGGKPSLKFAINSDTVIKAVQALLSSQTLRRYADDIAQKAAVVFRVVHEELQQNPGQGTVSFRRNERN